MVEKKETTGPIEIPVSKEAPPAEEIPVTAEEIETLPPSSEEAEIRERWRKLSMEQDRKTPSEQSGVSETKPAGPSGDDILNAGKKFSLRGGDQEGQQTQAADFEEEFEGAKGG